MGNLSTTIFKCIFDKRLFYFLFFLKLGCLSITSTDKYTTANKLYLPPPNNYINISLKQSSCNNNHLIPIDICVKNSSNQDFILIPPDNLSDFIIILNSDYSLYNQQIIQQTAGSPGSIIISNIAHEVFNNHSDPIYLPRNSETFICTLDIVSHFINGNIFNGNIHFLGCLFKMAEYNFNGYKLNKQSLLNDRDIIFESIYLSSEINIKVSIHHDVILLLKIVNSLKRLMSNHEIYLSCNRPLYFIHLKRLGLKSRENTIAVIITKECNNIINLLDFIITVVTTSNGNNVYLFRLDTDEKWWNSIKNTFLNAIMESRLKH